MMTLIKKTIILIKGKTAIGYINVVRVGSSGGAKIVVTETLAHGLTALVRIGANSLYAPIEKRETEITIPFDFNANDSVGVLVAFENGNVYARGGDCNNMRFVFPKKKETEQLIEEKTVEEVPINSKKVKDEQVASGIELPLDNTEASETTVDAENSDESETVAEIEDAEELSTESQIDAGKITQPETETEVLGETLISEDSQINQKSFEKGRSPFDIPTGERFYQSVRGRLSEMFTVYPREEKLEKMIPDSKFIHVPYDGEDYYVVGELSDENVVTHIVYGVPGVKSVKPPEEAEELCQFLATEENAEKGYWLIFQNSATGELLKGL